MGDFTFDKPVTDMIKKRTSIRTYNSEGLDKEVSEKIEDYIKQIRNPFNKNLRIKLITLDKLDGKKKLGTYGMIKGAKSYIAVAYKEGELDLEALGYEFESLVLYATSLGLGTCWMGGTFNKGQFSKAMELQDGEIFPIVSPIGFKGEGRPIFESIVKFTAKSHRRKDFSEIFFKDSFNITLSKEAAGKYFTPLEMLRLAPSAVNKQPWSVVMDGKNMHFYRDTSAGNMGKIDVGIALCHFHLTCIEESIQGEFNKLSDINSVDKYEYITSWIEES